MRTGLLLVVSIALAFPNSGLAFDWGPTGVPICGACVGDVQMLLSDGAGGAFIAFRDARHPSVSDDDVYLQRITSMGQIAPGWPPDGFPVCVAPRAQELSAIAPDGQG